MKVVRPPSQHAELVVDTMRVVRLQRPRVTGACDQCNEPCKGPMRYRIRVCTHDAQGNVVDVVEHACSKDCADKLAIAWQVEISLVNGALPRVKEYTA